jgi:hypothetical protein
MTAPAAALIRPTIFYYVPLVSLAIMILVAISSIAYWIAPVSVFAVLVVALALILLSAYLRYARTVELTASTLSWRGPLGGGEVPVAQVTSVRSSIRHQGR